MTFPFPLHLRDYMEVQIKRVMGSCPVAFPLDGGRYPFSTIKMKPRVQHTNVLDCWNVRGAPSRPTKVLHLSRAALHIIAAG